MADNVTLPGVGAAVATDDVGGVQYQRVKVALGADGAAADLAPGQATMAASVPVTIASNQSAVPVSDGSGSLTVDGDVTVTSPDTVITITPTVLNADAYDSGDLLFDSTEIAGAVRVNAGMAILQSITIIDKDDQGVAMTLLFANAATDFGELDSAPNADDSEAATIIGWVPVAASDYIDLGGAKVACLRNLGLLLKAGASTTSLYVAAMIGGAGTYTTGGLVLQVGLLRS